MKKILNLLSVLTITGTAIPNVIAVTPYKKKLENLNRTKRQIDPPSLKNIITNVNIGEVVINNPKNIISRLREINHPILSRPEFLDNIVFDTITFNTATVHTNHNVQNFIASSIRFNLNFTARIYNLYSHNLYSIVNNINLGIIDNNYEYTILERFQRINPNIASLNLNFVVLDIFQNQALLRTTNLLNNINIQVFLTTNNYTLESLTQSCYLSLLKNINEETIINRFLQLNPNVRRDDINRIENITNNSATIYGNIPSINVPTITTADGWTRPPFDHEINNAHYQNFNDSIEVSFTSSYLKNKINKFKIKELDMPSNPINIKNKKIQKIKIIEKNNNHLNININLNWNVTGPITNDEKKESKTIKLIKWSDHAQNWEEFKEKYKYLKINNINSSAGGSGTTIKNNKNITIEIKKINDLEYIKNINLVNYHYDSWFSPLIIIPWPTNQDAFLNIKYIYMDNNYIYATFSSYTHSELALYYVWTELKIKLIELS